MPKFSRMQAQSRGEHLAGEAEQQAKAWALGANSACDGIVVAQESSELACKEPEVSSATLHYAGWPWFGSVRSEFVHGTARAVPPRRRIGVGVQGVAGSDSIVVQ